MKISAVVVLYHPSQDTFLHIKKLENAFFNQIILIDNTEGIQKCTKNEGKVIYLAYGENKGIAKALKDGVAFALLEHMDYVLTLDQDSVFPFEQQEEIIEKLQKHLHQNVGIIALNYNYKYPLKKSPLELKQVITSGNFIKLDQYQKIHGFNENFFIDYVDFDLCHQFYKEGIKILLYPEINMEHTLGNPLTKRFLFWKIKTSNHAPIRYYYRYRNEKLCYLSNRRFFFKNHIREKLVLVRMFLFEPQKKEKWREVRRGKKDAKKMFSSFFSEVSSHD